LRQARSAAIHAGLITLAASAALALASGCGGTVAPAQPSVASTRTTQTVRATPGSAAAATRPSAAVVRAALIRHGDLGASWSREDKPPRSVACATDPWRDALLKQSSPIFRSDYVAVQGIVADFPDPRAARRARAKLGSAPAQRCFQRALRREGDGEMSAAHFEPVSILYSESPRPGVEATRSTMTAAHGADPGSVYIDEIRASVGVYVADAVFVSTSAQLEQHVYEALVEIVDKRLHLAAS
jgi:hypothetical protein